MRIFFTRILLPVCLLTLMSACRRTTPPADDGTPTLTVTIEPLRYFAEAIAGGHFEVNCMVPEGNSPETYDPTPRQLVELTKSRAYLRIGHIGFEQVWMERLEANAPGMQVFDTSRGISLIRDEGHAHGGHSHAGGVEPHIWNSPANARIIARNVCDALCRLDSANASFYTSRLDSLNRVINRAVFTLAAGILLVAGLVPKFASLLTTIPQCVIGGATISVFATITMTGIRMITEGGFTPRKSAVVGLSVALGVGITQVPGCLAGSHFPGWVATVFGSSSVVVATIMAILLNLILPKEPETKK